MNPTWLDLLKKDIRTKLSPRHVPHLFLQVKQLPYTPNGKKMELFCRDFFSGTKDLSVLRTIHPAVCEEYLPLRTAVLTPIKSQTFSHQIGEKERFSQSVKPSPTSISSLFHLSKTFFARVTTFLFKRGASYLSLYS